MIDVATRAARERRLLDRTTLCGSALVFVVVVTSAFLRLVRSGVGCDDWPLCYGAPLALASPGVVRALPWMQLTHLLAAAGVGVLALVAVVLSLQAPRRRATTSVAVALGAFTLFLAVLGRMAPGSQLPAVVLGNVLGGMTMLGLFWWLYLGAPAPASPARSPALAIAAVVALLLLAAQIAFGAILSANFAARACIGFPGCEIAPSHWDFAAFDPWRQPASPTAGMATDFARLTLHVVHRWSGMLVAVCFLTLAGAVWRARGTAARRVAGALGLLPLVQFGLGVALVQFEVPLAAAVAHSAASALLVMAAVSALHYSRSSDAADVSAACQTVTSK